MDAGTLEALRGRKLGGSALQRVIGAGTMGAVYLAHQSQPSRLVAVKVFLRAASLELQQQIEFLETFSREIAHVSFLEHPHIVSIYDYGDVDGLAYIVMPYIAGETLEELLAREGALPLATAANYLEQIAAALDYAHEQGIIHRDLKPSNILLTPEKRVLVADFHLTKMLIEGKTAQMRLSKPGLLDYMAPELVIGREVNVRSDLYSLGAILYRMVTGAAPFQGQTLMKVATKHLKMPPQPPRILRPDLPAAAEQAILKALAKKPGERFENAQDLHLLFRQAIPPISSSPINDSPKWRVDELTSVNAGQNSGETDAYAALNEQSRATSIALETEPAGATLKIDPATPIAPAVPSQEQEPAASGNVTRTLTAPEIKQEDTGITGTYKLTGPARIVTIPVVGQPGQYITGILPTIAARSLPASEFPAQASTEHQLLRRLRAPAFALAVLLIVLGSLTFWYYVHSSSNKPTAKSTATTVVGTPNLAASATARAMAALNANTILYDPLSQNIRDWPVATGGSALYQFKDGAYHITNNDAANVAPAILPGEVLNGPFAYSLALQEVRGDDTSINNQFGMIIRFNSQAKNGAQVVTFYSFEVLNNKGGDYQFWKYDNSQGAVVSPWKELAQHAFGTEYHQGQGPNSSNAFKILVNGKNFTLIVNGKQVWTVQDGSLTSGQVGMLVNLKGTEVAFSDLRLTFR